MSDLEKLLIWFFAAILSGYLEQFLMRAGAQPHLYEIRMGSNIVKGQRKKLFGWLIPAYHLPLGALWFLVCLALGEPESFPVFCVLQDWAWFRFHPDRLNPKAWVNAKLGGFYIFGTAESKNNWWMPFTYLIGVGLSTLFYILPLLI